jgi:hypothetical protein
MFGNLFATSLEAQIMPPVVYYLQVLPLAPTATDSVYVNLTYSSNDGCPDYCLVRDSASATAIWISTRNLDNSTRICTQVMSKFTTRINLGLLNAPTRIFVDGKCINTVQPLCTLTRKGVVVQGGEACSGKLLVSEHTPYMTLLPVLYSMERLNTTTTFKPGDEVRFGAVYTAPDSTRSTCHLVGDVLCCQLIETKPDCVMNKTGVIVPGIDGCTGQWFVKDLSPVYSYPRLYLIKNDGALKPGAKVLFGVTELPKDSARSILCPIYGTVNCYFYAEPILPDTLAGTAYTGDSVVKGGTAILFQKGFRKAMRSTPLKEGRFVFPNLAAAEYTVYIVPDRKPDCNYLPTFYINKLAYKNADYFQLKDGRNEIAVNMRKFEKRPGKGRIYGNVYFETSNLKDSVLNYYGDKNYLYTTSNNLAVNLPVILFNAQGNPIAWTMSDEFGNYLFEDIALEAYTIVTETAETEAETSVTLSTENSAIGADMILKSQSLIDEATTPTRKTLELYTNPAGNTLIVQLASPGQARIYNQLGQVVLEQTLSAGKNLIGLQGWKPGIYIARIGQHAQKFLLSQP